MSEELKRYLGETGISISKLARELRVSRQSIYDYRDGKRTPSCEQLAKLLGLRGFSVKIGGKMLKPEDFPKRAPVPQYEQQELAFEPMTLESEGRNLKIGVKSTRGGVLEFTVRIKLAG